MIIALLFTATLVFSWGFFQKVHAHFHVLMLVFMAGMVGFCLTGDLFNMFVWFELMSVAGFAATGYALRSSAIAGALNFTVVNTVGAYVFLSGIALLYGQIGALDLVALGRGVAADPGEPVVILGFVLVATALLTKAAQVPFQMWLGDAHAVAPSPISVIFSGAMVSIALFGLGKLGFRVFGGATGIVHGIQTMLLAIGLASAVVGAILALGQRHIKTVAGILDHLACGDHAGRAVADVARRSGRTAGVSERAWDGQRRDVHAGRVRRRQVRRDRRADHARARQAVLAGRHPDGGRRVGVGRATVGADGRGLQADRVGSKAGGARVDHAADPVQRGPDRGGGAADRRQDLPRAGAKYPGMSSMARRRRSVSPASSPCRC